MQKKNYEYIIILFIILFVTFLILSLSLINQTGYMSGDSYNYLRLSGRIIEGHGFFLPSNGRENAVERWFAIWPVGYPILISAVAMSLGVSTFLASKILNIILIFLSIFSLYIALGRKGLIASFILLTASSLRNYTMTWSEAPFLTSLIILCLFLGKIINRDFELKNYNLVILFFLLILPFLFRYVGLFVVAPTCLVAIYLFFQGRKRESIFTLVVTFFSLTFCIIYLINNFQLTGYITGMERPPTYGENRFLLSNLIKSILQEFILIVPSWDKKNLIQNVVVGAWILFSLFILFIIFKNIKQERNIRNVNSFSNLFIIFGFIYLCAIIFLRWSSNFSHLGFTHRLLNPGFALIFIGFFLWVLDKSKKENKPVIIFAFVTVVLVATGNLYSNISKYGLNTNYSIHINKMKKIYAKLPDDAVVIFGGRELKYLRPSIKIASPKTISDSKNNETWTDFLSDLEKSAPIFIETHNRLNNYSNYHESVGITINSLPSDEVLQIRKPTEN